MLQVTPSASQDCLPSRQRQPHVQRRQQREMANVLVAQSGQRRVGYVSEQACGAMQGERCNRRTHSEVNELGSRAPAKEPSTLLPMSLMHRLLCSAIARCLAPWQATPPRARQDRTHNAASCGVERNTSTSSAVNWFADISLHTRSASSRIHSLIHLATRPSRIAAAVARPPVFRATSSSERTEMSTKRAVSPGPRGERTR